jgi:hypothetical protein
MKKPLVLMLDDAGNAGNGSFWFPWMPPATAATYATNRDPTKPPDAKGQTHGSGGRDTQAGADPEDPDTRVASYGVANRSSLR